MENKMEIKKKEQMFRGKTLEELNALGVREFAKLVKARERRTINRNFQQIEDFINRCNNKLKKNKAIKTHDREIIITPSLVGKKISVHNGNQFIPVEITIEMLGHRLGEFSLTRNKVKHTKSGVGSTKGSKSKSKK